jgi:hypothetical protein
MLHGNNQQKSAHVICPHCGKPVRATLSLRRPLPKFPPYDVTSAPAYPIRK